jgi:hypothetical protein
MARGEVMAVRMEVVRAVLIEGMAREVSGRLDAAEPPERLAGAAAHAGGDERAVRVAHAGWLAREVELERFERARVPAPWLRAALLDRSPGDPAAAVGAVCADLAAREPLARPAPDDPDAATWRVAGPGGHVRHELALEAIRSAGGGPPALKRCWVHGFLARCCEDALGG